MVVLDEKGVSDFSALPNAIRKAPDRLVFVAFDLLYLDGHDRRWDTLHGRRLALWNLVKPATGKIQFSQQVDIEGADFFRAVDAMELEGIISKKATSTYVSGPSKTWLKTKCFTETEYEVIGLKRAPGQASLALMATPGRKPKYVGAAIIALKSDMRERLWKRVQDGAAPKGMAIEKAEWVRPGLIGRVRHLKGEQKLRHATLTEIKEKPKLKAEDERLGKGRLG